MKSYFLVVLIGLCGISENILGAVTELPTYKPTRAPTKSPTWQPTSQPIGHPSKKPSRQPTSQPTKQPINRPTSQVSICLCCVNCHAFAILKSPYLILQLHTLAAFQTAHVATHKTTNQSANIAGTSLFMLSKLSCFFSDFYLSLSHFSIA